MGRYFLQALNIINDHKNKPRDKLKYNGKLVFEINEGGGNKKKDIEFIPVNNFNNPNKEYIVEIPLKKNSTVINQVI